jgi:hypothetical protein
MAGSGTENTDSVNIPQHAVFVEVNIGVIDKVPTRNTTNTNTCVLSSCCVKCYYKLKPFSVCLCFNLRVKKIFFFTTNTSVLCVDGVCHEEILVYITRVIGINLSGNVSKVGHVCYTALRRTWFQVSD